MDFHKINHLRQLASKGLEDTLKDGGHINTRNNLKIKPVSQNKIQLHKNFQISEQTINLLSRFKKLKCFL